MKANNEFMTEVLWFYIDGMTRKKRWYEQKRFNESVKEMEEKIEKAKEMLKTIK